MTKYFLVAVLALGGVFAVGCDDTNPTPVKTDDGGTDGGNDGGPDSSVPACESATNLLNKCSSHSCFPFDNAARLDLQANGQVKPLP